MKDPLKDLYTVDQASSDMTDDAFKIAMESAHQDIHSALNLVHAVEYAFRTHFEDRGDQSFEAYQADVSLILTVTGVDVPVQVITGLSLEAAEAKKEDVKDGLLKRAWEAFLRFLERVKSWFNDTVRRKKRAQAQQTAEEWAAAVKTAADKAWEEGAVDLKKQGAPDAAVNKANQNAKSNPGQKAPSKTGAFNISTKAPSFLVEAGKLTPASVAKGKSYIQGVIDQLKRADQGANPDADIRAKIKTILDGVRLPPANVMRVAEWASTAEEIIKLGQWLTTATAACWTANNNEPRDQTLTSLAVRVGILELIPLLDGINADLLRLSTEISKAVFETPKRG